MNSNKRAVLFIIALLVLDQCSKIFMVEFDPHSIVRNSGWMGGSFSQTNAVFRIGTLIGFFSAILIFLATFWAYLQRTEAYLRYSVFAFFAGLTGNFIDRIRLGYVIDFIPVRYHDYQVTFNVADFFQWGAVIAYFIFSNFGKAANRPEDRRNKIFAHRRLQMKLFTQLSLIFGGFLLSLNALFYLSLKTNSPEQQGVFLPLMTVSLCYGFLFETLLFMVIVSETTKWLGPIHSFIQYRLHSKRGHRFRLRKLDEFKELESIANADYVVTPPPPPRFPKQ